MGNSSQHGGANGYSTSNGYGMGIDRISILIETVGKVIPYALKYGKSTNKCCSVFALNLQGEIAVL